MSTSTVSSNALSFDTPLSFRELVTSIVTFAPTVSLSIASEPGVGKSSLLPAVAEYHGDAWRKPGDNFADDKYVYIYVDCPMMDFADFGMRVPHHETGTLKFYPSSLFRMDDPRPKVIMFDERFKALKALQPLFTRADLERTIGDAPLATGSMVFSTTNNSSDGVGDTILAHSANRLMQVQMKKPSATEWAAWATTAGLDSRLRAACMMNPRLFESYKDGVKAEDNPYIFTPKRGSAAFASPRSLAKCDVVIRNSNVLGDRLTLAALSGLVGVAAAEKLHAVMSLQREITKPEDILADPMGASIPTSIGAIYLTLFNAVDRVEVQDDLSAVVDFTGRLGSVEFETLLFNMIMRDKTRAPLGNRNARVRAWTAANLDMAML